MLASGLRPSPFDLPLPLTGRTMCSRPGFGAAYVRCPRCPAPDARPGCWALRSPRVTAAQCAVPSRDGELSHEAEMTHDGAHDFHLRFAEQSRFERGGKLDDAVPTSFAFDEHFGNPQESAVQKIDIHHGALAINATTAGERVHAVSQDGAVQFGQRLGENEAPAGHVANA